MSSQYITFLTFTDIEEEGKKPPVTQIMAKNNSKRKNVRAKSRKEGKEEEMKKRKKVFIIHTHAEQAAMHVKEVLE